MGEDRSGGDRRVRHIGRSILSGLPLELMSSLGFDCRVDPRAPPRGVEVALYGDEWWGGRVL